MAREAFDKLPQDKKTAIIKSGMDEFSQKSYSEASTDEITKNCGISKGLLFHYFGSKKDFYLFCLEQALDRLIIETPEPEANDFYGIIFSFMDEKFEVCRKYREEMRIVNMAARETNSQVYDQKNTLLARYMAKTREASVKAMARAVSALRLKKLENGKVVSALGLYIGAIINRYLEMYKEEPDKFFEHSEEIKAEVKAYLDLMLYGIVREGV